MAIGLNTIVFIMPFCESILIFSSLAIGQKLVGVLVKCFADFKCIIDTINKVLPYSKTEVGALMRELCSLRQFFSRNPILAKSLQTKAGS